MRKAKHWRKPIQTWVEMQDSHSDQPTKWVPSGNRSMFCSFSAIYPTPFIIFFSTTFFSHTPLSDSFHQCRVNKHSWPRPQCKFVDILEEEAREFNGHGRAQLGSIYGKTVVSLPLRHISGAIATWQGI